MNTKKNVTNVKKEKGITLVALVITIVILIILATITINIAFGEGGLIQRAQQAKELTEQAVKDEAEKLNEIMSEYANIMGEDLEIPNPPDLPEPDTTLVEKPKLTEGMIPVKYVEGIGWVKTTKEDPEWYNYAENKKQWANVVLGDATFNTLGEYEVLNEDVTYSMLVWIPRYAYKITSLYKYSSESGGNVEIVFIDTENKDKNGQEYSKEYPTVTDEGTEEGTMDDFVVHPAFTFATNELEGFWTGKFETSNTEKYGDDETANDVNLTVQIKGGVQSWRNITLNNIYTVCTELNKTGNAYKLSDDDSIVDPHLMKSIEWGAVAFLTQSKYGKNSEVLINSNENYYTGGGEGKAYLNNVAQSTTGNETGIYDMSGGANEYIAGYNLRGTSILNPIVGESKYWDIYANLDSDTLNGDGISETNSSVINQTCWYADHFESTIVSQRPRYIRGGDFDDGDGAGLFSIINLDGKNYAGVSFRVVIPVI